VFGQPLLLTSCGVREMWWQNLYLVSLYLPKPTRDVATILSSDIEKAVRLDVLYDGQIPESMPESWRLHLEQQRVPTEVMQQLTSVYAKVARVGSGAVLFLAYAPGTGTVVTLNGTEILHERGAALINALLNLWLGPDPESENLRRLLLQGSC
jgi:hypothetical protein